MKGAKTEPSETTKRTPITKRKTTIGKSHHFLLAFKKLQNSTIIDALDMLFILNYLKIQFQPLSEQC